MAPSARVLRQLIVNACSLSNVAFTLLASFRGLVVSSCASFERLTLYHSRVIKQADFLRAVFRSRPDLRCIEGHRRRPLPFFADIFCSMCAGFAAACLLIAVSLSRLASAISMAHNAQSTLPIQLVASTQNAEAPAVGCGGRFGRKLSGESCLLVARLRWGRVQSACGGCSPSEWNRRARCGRFNLCGDAVARTDCLAPDSLTG